MERSKEANKESGKKNRFFKVPSPLELFVFLLLLALTVVVIWPFVTVTIDGGYVGVYYSKFFGGTVLNKTYGEGIHLVLPWDRLIPYDARAQSQDYSITALAKGGLNVNVNMSIIWYIKKDQVGKLHSTMGPDYAQNVIDPSVVSVVRSTIGRHEQSRLYDGNPLQLQEDVKSLLNETLSDAPFSIHTILVREVKLPDQMTSAISEKFVSEQNVLAERYRVLEAVERFKRTYVDSEGERMAQSVVSAGMSEAYLRYLGIQATTKLAESNNAKLVIIGDKDGLPLMLNADTLTTSDTLPEGLDEDGYLDVGGTRKTAFVDTYNRIDAILDEIDKVKVQLTERFPEQNSTDIDTTIPQISNVPIADDKEAQTQEQEKETTP